MFVVQVIAALVGETVVSAGAESVNFEFPLELAKPVQPEIRLETNSNTKSPNVVDHRCRQTPLFTCISFPQLRICTETRWIPPRAVRAHGSPDNGSRLIAGTCEEYWSWGLIRFNVRYRYFTVRAGIAASRNWEIPANP